MTCSTESGLDNAYRVDDLLAWWRCGDEFTFAATVADAFLDSAVYDADSPRNMGYFESRSDERPTLHVPDPELWLADDGAVQFNGTTPFGATGQGFDPDPVHAESIEDIDYFLLANISDRIAMQTVVCRIKPNDTDATVRPYVGNWWVSSSDAQHGWMFDVKNLVIQFKAWNDGGDPDITLVTGTVVADEWYSLAATWTGTVWSLYLDGVLVDSEAGTTAPPFGVPGSGGFRFGSGIYREGHGLGSAIHYCDGGLDEVALYGRVLTDDEILSIADLTECDGVVSLDQVAYRATNA